MAQKIGKYKISKKESELSIVDGGTIKGEVSVQNGNLTVTGSFGVSATTHLNGATTITHAGIKFSGLTAGTATVSSSLDAGQVFKTGSNYISQSQVNAAQNVAGSLFDVLCVTR